MNGHRSGKTLIEVIVILSVTSVALMLATTTLVALFRVERQIRSDATQMHSLARLASRWRADVHGAVAVTAAADCELKMPDGRTILYAYAAPRVSRELRRGQSVEHRDAFVLPSQAAVSFSAKPQQEGQIAQLSITTPDSPGRAYATPVRPAAIAAIVNLHRLSPKVEDAP